MSGLLDGLTVAVQADVRTWMKEAGIKEEIQMDGLATGGVDILQALEQAGFKPETNVDEDFPPLKGEYATQLTVLRPFVDEKSQEKTAYLATWKVTQTLDGDLADGRTLSRFYRLGGVDFNGQPIMAKAAQEALRGLLNDLFTMGVELPRGSTEEFEAAFPQAIGKPAYLRAWWFSPKDDADRKIQQFKVKTERDLRKGSKDTAGGKTARAPF